MSYRLILLTCLWGGLTAFMLNTTGCEKRESVQPRTLQLLEGDYEVFFSQDSLDREAPDAYVCAKPFDGVIQDQYWWCKSDINFYEQNTGFLFYRRLPPEKPINDPKGHPYKRKLVEQLTISVHDKKTCPEDKKND